MGMRLHEFPSRPPWLTIAGNPWILIPISIARAREVYIIDARRRSSAGQTEPVARTIS
jgi:hypothetical protein